MNEQHFSARSMTKIALCVAFCCVTAWFSFPLPFTPGLVTALTMALGLAAFVLTPKETFVAVSVYLLLGICGLPVFTGGTSGLGRILGPTGGFWIVWLFVYPLVSALKGAVPDFRRYALVDIVVGMPLTYLGGMVSMMLVLDITLWQAVMMAVVPFIPGDILKCLAAAALGVRVNKMLETV
ncbi:MAG: biotin transporter BioY [Schwartzia sp.]|nr:biotin transporter BioY [Schwartzia sp. (in: firmicutes)]MBR1552574.1 biotin transporter BioY [Schwartzia sp. (in: firmicutes)]